ncbi:MULTISPECIES: hypothetical protein [Streptomyces]|uniref:hypothetical protein n=1 Tax=Streptomyces TaxID=1883 RepID=UPI0018A825A4|nr:MULTISPECIES: hypothetical protein [Streptomyces]MBF8169545.1 hypothetical protein [Streptomyces olivaceus]MBZ6141161.1 hypothetical protein [Streptomyces olivaceus]MBZ6168927.1 hypothetical protein [Streptomyces olivaceus]WFB88199.1 hypothetical protein MMU79_35585 [Streptomyces olivaceus]WGK47803.1 hypothetical protein M6G09_20695 [Streptomyces sp. B146]
MTTPEESDAPLAETFECAFDFQPGWVDLTLREGTRAEAQALATRVVDDLNPMALEIEKSAVFDDMVDRAVDLNDDVPTLAAAYYSEAGEALANLVVDSYGDEGVPRPGAEEVTPLLLDWANARVAGEPGISHLELPAGPAVRVQAMLQVKRMFGFGRKLTEFARYAVFPQDLQSLVVVTVTWEKLAMTERITELADEAVQTLRLTPRAAGGGV